ncbi:hypothetical protein [Pseudomonas veronii]|uniref:hypothetical protein n=1 Tax=Pseudomonas veronii TaxID=76761 RepID=UPI000F82C616|nr:hypothetical protein [Pseudomonas veronii]RTY63426.1 hypothetical protein EKA83_33310 [Pseudomonas veronii]
MTDNTELKRLAEALIAATDVYMADECNDYLATNWAAADDAYQQATLPETVLALISENERLKNRLEVDPRHDYDGISTRDATVKVLDEQVDQLKADNERLEVEVKRMTSIAYAAHGAFRMETMAERDQLRAEVAGLKTGYEAYERVNAELKAEVEGLRKDAERYRWLRRAGNTKAIALVAEHCLDALDEAIDAALGNGEQP